MFIVCRLILRVDLRALFRAPRAILLLSAAGLCVSCTWWLYIYAINSGHVLQASLAYYINPLVVILFGVFFFHERLTVIQLIAALLATVGVLYFTVDYGQFPWLSVIMAVTFAIYGVLKKKGGYPALSALAVETTVIAPLGLVFVIATFFLLPDRGFMVDPTSLHSWLLFALLFGAGPVTILPLLLFAQGTNAIPLSWMGFLQYIGPTITFALGVFAYGEPFTFAHVVCFSLIWIGLILVSVETIVHIRRQNRYEPGTK
jgi:chloramphenicol-sensitive protein RarD